MIPPSFDYVAPKTLSEAIDALGEYENAKILVGGQSLIPLMRFRLASPAVLVDLNRVEGLSYLKEEDGCLKIGSMTRESTLDHSPLVKEKYPLIAGVHFTSEYNGRTYYFCAAGCKRSFEKEPEKYIQVESSQ
jgi:carbon-monoxide dehydrogenase medium subunit